MCQGDGEDGFVICVDVLVSKPFKRWYVHLVNISPTCITYSALLQTDRLGKTSKYIGCRPNIQQLAAAILYRKNYT